MLKIFDKNHNAIGHIVKYKDCKIESELSTGDKTLFFTYLARHHNLENEMYVRTKEDEYVIKEVPGTTGSFPQIVAVLNLEDLQKDMWQTFSVTDVTIDEAVRTVLAGTGWTIGECNVTKRRNAGMMQVSSLEVIQNLCKAFMCEPVFDTINKKVSFYVQRGEDKGVYFMSGMNLKKLQKKSTSYDYYTRIIPIGANGLTIESVNDGKNYLENYKYSSKELTYIWKDESYTDAQALKDDAELKLNDLSKPTLSYSADVRDLAKQKTEYAILSYSLGDNVTLIDRETVTRDKQRIVKLVEYPQNPEKNTCELANTVLTFEEMQQKVQEAANIINFTIAGDGRYTGTINVSDILHFEQGVAGSATISGINSSISSMQGDLAHVKITVGEIDANYIKADEADLKYATIENLAVTNETVHSIQGDYASFKSTVTDELAATTADITNLTGRFSTFEQTVTDELITAKGWMAEGSIGSAQISSVDANKIKSGTIDTAIVTIAGSDGRLQISDNTMQISDANRVRVQVGKDASGDYTLAVWDSAGKLIWDALGATENTIQRKIIRDKMVADDAAIQALKLDLQSFNTALTNQGVTISGTVVQVGNKTLNVALAEQSQAISEHGETLTDHATKIAANEKGISLKVSTQEYESYKTTVNGEITSAKNRLSTAESSITALNGQIALKVEQTDIDSAVKKVDDKFANYSTTTQMNTAINQKADSITQSVSATYATKSSLETANGNITSLTSRMKTAESKLTKDGLTTIVGDYYTTATVVDSKINGIQVGGRNLWINSSKYRESTPYLLTASGTDNYVLSFDGKFIYSTEPFKAGDIITVQGKSNLPWAKTHGGSSANNGTVGYWLYYGTLEQVKSGNYTSPAFISFDGVNTVFKRTLTIPSISGLNTIYIGFRFNSYSYNNVSITAKFWDIKLEKGNKATDWTPAPEDADAAISAVETIATQTSEKFSWLVKSGTSSTDFTLTDRTASLVANAINLKGLVTFDGLSSSAKSSIVDSVQVGGRNLLVGTNQGKYHWNNGHDGGVYGIEEVKWNGVNAVKMTCTTATTSWKMFLFDGLLPNFEKLEPGGTYTLSYDVAGSIKAEFVDLYDPSATNGLSNKFTLVKRDTTNYGYHYEYRIVLKDSLVKSEQCVYLTNELTDNTEVIIANLKLEIGNKATDWTPAPEDVDSSISAVDTALANLCYDSNKTYINGGKIYTGTITATQIASKAITADKLNVTSLSAISANLGSVTAGSINIGSGKFIVTSAGALTATGATISGTVTSISGTIGGWTISDGCISTWRGGSKEINNIDHKEAAISLYSDGSLYAVQGNGSDDDVVVYYSEPTYTKIVDGQLEAGNARFKGNFLFQDYSNTMRRPVASVSGDGSRVGYMGSSISTGVKIAGQWNVAGASFSVKTFTASSSDIRLKENIRPTEVNALSVINQMGLYQFDWKLDGYHQKIGFVADYLEQQDEHLAIGGGYDEDGNMDEKVVNDFYLMGYAIKGIQELSTIATMADARLTDIETISRSTQSEMDSLKSQVSSLQYQLEQAYTKIAALEKQLQAAG